MEHDAVSKYAAEFIGVYFLVLTVGCNVHSGSIGGALSVGSMLAVMVYALGSVSGGHLNPAVTLCIALRGGHITAPDALMYMCAQFSAAVTAAMTYAVMQGDAFKFAPVWHYTAGAALSVELLYSCLLCYVVLNVATTVKDAGNQYFGLAVGLTVSSAALGIGHVSGCSLNPAVSFGCLFAAGVWGGFSSINFWGLYVLTPFLAALIAVVLFGMVRPDEMGRYQPTKRPEPVPEPAPVAPPGPPQLQAGESYALPKSLESCDIAVGLSYELHDPSLRGMLEIDGSCVKFDNTGRCCGAVYFADKEDGDNGIVHYGLHTGELGSPYAHGDDDQIRFRLERLRPNVHFMFFVVTLYSDGHHVLQAVRKCQARLLNQSAPSNASEVLQFTRTFGPAESGNAYVIGMLMRTKEGWAWEAIDKSYTLLEAGTYRMLEPQLQRLCLQKLETAR
jgi:aquaporin Z